MAEDSKIYIRPEAFGAGFDVTAEPPIEGHPLDKEYPDLKHARGYASGLKMTLGFPVVDQTGEPQ